MVDPQFSESVVLEVPADYAFAFLADPRTASVIDPAVVEYHPDTTPMQPGTKTQIRFRMWGIPLSTTSEVKEWHPSERMVMENIQPARPVRAVATHDFVPEGDRCTYTWAMNFTPVGILGRVAAPLMCRFMRTNAKRQQARFQQEVERRWTDQNPPTS